MDSTDKGIIIQQPRAHRAAWIKRHPAALIENGGLLSKEDLERWACDVCMEELNPDQPIKVIGSEEGYSVCEKCAAKFTISFESCSCAGCAAFR